MRGASVVERCARAVAYLAHHIARATATAEQGQQARSWFSTCSQCCADDRCSSRPPTCGRSTSTVLVRGTSQRHPPSLLPYRYSPGCWMPLAHPHCDGCRSTPASLTTTEVPGRAQNRARLLGTGAEEAQSAADRTHVRCPPLTGRAVDTAEPLLLVVPWPAAKQMRLDGARGRGLPPVPLRPRQPGLAEGYGTLDQAYAG